MAKAFNKQKNKNMNTTKNKTIVINAELRKTYLNIEINMWEPIACSDTWHGFASGDPHLVI